MIYKFTSSATNVLEYANEVALKIGHEYIGTEHILYGLVKEKIGIANKVLQAQNITAEEVYSQIEEIIGTRKTKIKENLRFYSKNKKNIRKCFK